MSSNLPYAPYQSHRRAASSASASAATTSSQVEVQQQRPTTTLQSGSVPHASKSPSFIRQSAPQPSTLQRMPNGTSHSSAATATAAVAPSAASLTVPEPSLAAHHAAAPAPPPLRSLSSLRTRAGPSGPIAGAIEANAGNKGKEKETAPKGGNAASSSTVQSPTRRTVSSSLTVPSAPGPSTASSALEAKANGHSKRISLSPSPVPGHAHSRSLSNSGGALPATLPHHMSTAQRLRTVSPLGQRSPPTSSPSHTPMSLSPTSDASLGSTSFPHHMATLPGPNGLLGDGLGRTTVYRPGFQPKGMYRVRTDEFVAARARRKQGGRPDSIQSSNDGGGESSKSRSELESQRLERRLEKLLSLHYDEGPLFSEEEAYSVAPSWLPNTIRKARLEAEMEKRLREEEMRIVKWEDDKSRKACAVCSTPFSLTVRKHHCRTCGRLVCASPHLSLPPGVAGPAARAKEAGGDQIEEVKCSGLVIADGKGGTKIKDVPRWDEAGGQSLDSEGRTRGIRICRECKETILHRQYMLDDGKVPPYLKLYEALISLQKEIEQSLPEFQEMVLGLQKHDAAAALGTAAEDEARDPLLQPPARDAQTIAAIKAKNRTTLALQRDAAQARKQLLANFANFDLIAKKIRNLDDEGNASLGRLKIAIWTQANVFLQNNMFPLQNLPKLGSGKDTKASRSGTSTPSTSTQQAGQRTTTGSTKANDVEATQADGEDPAAVRESLAVLEQQLGLVRRYAASASKARKFQDASSLNGSARDLEAEIERLRRRLPS